MRILLINPNSSAAVTEALAQPAKAMLGAGDVLLTCHASSGPAVIQTPAQVQQAAEVVLALAKEHGQGCDGFLIGMSLDSGLAALRQQLPGLPVVGMTQAACLHASALGERFGVLTLGGDMAPLYAQHIAELGLASQLLGVAAAPWSAMASQPSGGSAQPQLDVAAMSEACQPLIAQGAKSIVLAGAVLSGLAPSLRRLWGVPVLDGTACGVGLLRSLHALAQSGG